MTFLEELQANGTMVFAIRFYRDNYKILQPTNEGFIMVSGQVMSRLEFRNYLQNELLKTVKLELVNDNTLDCKSIVSLFCVCDSFDRNAPEWIKCLVETRE